MDDIKYVKDHKTGNRFYPVVKSEGIVDAFSINNPLIDLLFNNVTEYFVKENIYNLNLTPGLAIYFTLVLKTDGPIDESEIKWSSSNPEVVAVDNGTVTAINEGSATIYVSSDLYNVHISFPINVWASTWTITYKSPVEVPYILDIIPTEIKNNIKYYYSCRGSLVETALGGGMLLTYLYSEYDKNTLTGKWVFTKPAISPILGTSFRLPISTSNPSKFSLIYGMYDLAVVLIFTEDTSNDYDYELDVSSITELEFQEGPASINFIDLRNFTNLLKLTLPLSIISIYLGHALSGDVYMGSIYRDHPALTQGLVYVLPKNITHVSYPKMDNADWGRIYGVAWDLADFDSIEVHPENTVYDSRDNCHAIIETASDTLVVGCGKTIIPDSIKRIENAAFAGCKGMTDIVIPEGVTSIGYCAFMDSDIKNVKWNCSLVSSIPDYCFEKCTQLETLEFAEGVVDAGDCILGLGTSLKRLIFPDSFRYIGPYTIRGNIEHITIGLSLCETMYSDGLIHYTLSLLHNAKTIAVTQNSTLYDTRDNCNALIRTEDNCLIATALEAIIPVSVTSVSADSFGYYSENTYIHSTLTYAGSTEQWAQVQLPDNHTITTVKCSDGTINY